MHGKFIWIFPSHLFYLKRCCTNNLNHHDIWLISEYTKSRRWLSVWLQFQLIKCMRLKHTFYILSKRRWSSRRFPYGYLVTTSPSSKNRDSNTTKDHNLIPALFGWCDGRCVQGAGTYSPRNSDTRLLRIPASWERVTVLNPNYD